MMPRPLYPRTMIDVQTPGVHSDEMRDWLVDHEISTTCCFKILFAGKRACVHEYALNDEGAKFVKDDGEVAVRDPYWIDVKRPLPDFVKPKEA